MAWQNSYGIFSHTVYHICPGGEIIYLRSLSLVWGAEIYVGLSNRNLTLYFTTDIWYNSEESACYARICRHLTSASSKALAELDNSEEKCPQDIVFIAQKADGKEEKWIIVNMA